jgi:hypothetical protein
MSVSFLTDIIEDEWRDYGIVGDLAVSKFTSLRNTFYRSLSEDFSPQRLEIAHNRWHALPTRWSTSMGSDPETITRLLG